MEWKAITEEQLWDDLNSSEARMSREQRNLWEVIRILPEKWKQVPWGNEGEGFWVIAIYGRTAIWYNDIEDGYNRSSYSECGVINEYRCNQDNLEWTLQHILDEIRDGFPPGYHMGPPEPIA